MYNTYSQNVIYMVISISFFRERKKAAETAFDNRSEEELNYVLSKCGPNDKQLVDSIRSMKQQLGKRWHQRMWNSGRFFMEHPRKQNWKLLKRKSAIHEFLSKYIELCKTVTLLCLCRTLLHYQFLFYDLDDATKIKEI